MNIEEYNLILRALNVFEEHEEEKELKNKLIQKLNLYVESDKLRNDYQDKMQKISNELNDLLVGKAENDKDNN